MLLLDNANGGLMVFVRRDDSIFEMRARCQLNLFVVGIRLGMFCLSDSVCCVPIDREGDLIVVQRVFRHCAYEFAALVRYRVKWYLVIPKFQHDLGRQ